MSIGVREESLTSLQRHLDEYHVYLNRAIAAVQTLKMTDPDSEEFSQWRNCTLLQRF
ncbi:MAG: hypothetical protein ACFE0J_21230 [Elainellaceae cyanobacterium]